MLKLCMIFLTAELLSGCALFQAQIEPQHATADLAWDFYEVSPGDTRACLTEDDVEKLRKAMLSCEVK